MRNKGEINPKIKFPILTVFENIVAVSPSEEIFTVWSKTVAKNEPYYQNLKIYDSDGVQYSIKKIQTKGYSNIFLGLDIFLDQTVFVKIELEKLFDFNIEDFRNTALQIANLNSDYYVSAGIEKESVINNINKVKSFSEIFYNIVGTKI